MGIYQIVYTPPLFGSTFVGGRAYRTFSSPNNLGMSMLAIMLLLVLRKPRGWLPLTGVCVAVVICAGSRTGLLGTVLVLATGPLSRSHFRLLWLYPALFSVNALGFVFTQKAFSGRDIDQEGRFTMWARLMESISGPLDWIFGEGLSAGSNAAYTFGLTQQGIVTDSTLMAALMSFGLAGLFGLAVGLVKLIRHAELEARWRCLPVLLLAGMSFKRPRSVSVEHRGCADYGLRDALLRATTG